MHVETFFVGNRRICEIHVPTGSPATETQAVSSAAFFCPACGDIWGRRFMQPDPRWTSRGWRPYVRECPRHGGGSLIFPLEEDRLSDPFHNYPPELLLWELFHTPGGF